MATRMHRGANDDTEWEFDELEDFYAPVVGMSVELIEAGRMNEDRPEDRVALRLSKSGAGDLSDREMDILDDRLNPLVELYWRDRDAFEIEFARRREPGFYDPPQEPSQDDSQGELF